MFSSYLIGQNSAQIRFIRSYNVYANAYGGSIEQTPDLGYITSGAYLDTVPTGFGDSTVIEIVSLIKTDSIGIAQWIKSYNLGANCAYGGAAIRTFDGGYIYTTTYTDSSGNNPDVFVFKTDALGNVTWSNSYGGIGREYSMSIVQAPDSGYAIVAYSNTHTLVRGDFYLVKINKVGSYQFGKRYDFNDYEDFPMFIQKTSSGYLMCGYSTNYDTATYITDARIYLVKTDWNGNPIWNKTYSNSDGYLTPYNFRETSQHEIIITGTKQDTLNSSYKTTLFFLKTDSVGNPMNSKEYWLSDSLYSYNVGYSIVQDYDSSYLICGSITDNNYRYVSALIKINSNGSPLYCNVFADTLNIMSTFINKAKDKGTILTGMDYYYGYLMNMKYDSAGKIGCADSLVNLKSATVNVTSSSNCNVNNIGSEIYRPVIIHSITPNNPIQCVSIDSVPHTDPPINHPGNNTYSITIPNVFTPNNDNVNDVWNISSRGYTGFTITIYNRWGEKVFITNDFSESWNGNFLNKEIKCSDGTYYYIVNCKNEILKKSENYRGFILLER